MSAVLPDAQALRHALWDGPLPDPAAPGSAVLEALGQGADYGAVLRALRLLHQLDLPAASAAQAARAHWPESIDMARLALEFCAPDAVPQALEALAECVERANRRRAVLASACLRHGQPARGWDALARIDPASPSVVADIRRRVDWAVAMGDFASALRDLDWLDGRVQTGAQRLWLAYRRDGAAAIADALGQDAAPESCAMLFEIFQAEGDLTRAGQALALWRDCPASVARARAETRQMLECGEGGQARAQLAARLDSIAPSDWEAADHLQWLRAGHMLQEPVADLLAHAQAALRLHPRHDGVHHLAQLLREAVTDWRAITLDLRPDHATLHARAALRMGLPGLAARRLRPALRLVAATPRAARCWGLRAEALAQAGRVGAALHAAERAMTLARDSVQRADCALRLAELHLLDGAPTRAAQALTGSDAAFPDRLPYLLMQARIAFHLGDFSRAQALHARFNMLKHWPAGERQGQDVRDRIVACAASAAQGAAHAFAPDRRVQDTLEQAGLAQISASAGLSACTLLRASHQGALEFTPAPDAAIPRQIAHYWQGPPGPALPRAQAQWAALHPGFACQTFDAETASDWLHNAHGPRMAAQFQALDHPALRADLFRLCWLVTQGGVFADLDEYPRLPVTPLLAGARLVLCIERGFGTIANNFAAAMPGHPALTRALEYVQAELAQTDAPYPWWHTGPAQWTRAALGAWASGSAGPGLRFLTQSEYCRRITTNLPYPHKRSPDHWR
ncbi:MAG: hypothetical protein JJU09_03250 [Rhodobacteraceae bacterium]|nr:hypothetical protein [Paracoccaceae bacterium]TVR50235.1 MAG: hypothetical protein EA386_00405 [Paracoccaceae bacterium]